MAAKSTCAILFLTIIGFSLANPIWKDDASDAFIDATLENLRRIIVENNLDPAPLPDGEVGFSDTILGVTFHGSAKVYNGFFRGLSTINRNGGTNLEDLGNGQFKLSANLGIGRSTAGYSASAEFMGIGVSASASATIAKVDCFFEAEMCLQSGCKATLKSFEIKEIGNIDVDFDGLGPLDWILGTVTGFVADLIKDFLKDVIEGPIRDLLQGVLDDYPLP